MTWSPAPSPSAMRAPSARTPRVVLALLVAMANVLTLFAPGGPSLAVEPVPIATPSSEPTPEPTIEPAPTPEPTIEPAPTPEPTPTETATPEPPSESTTTAGAEETDDEPTFGLLAVNPAGTFIANAQAFYAFVDAGETLDVLFTRIADRTTNDVVITVTDPTGTGHDGTAHDNPPGGPIVIADPCVLTDGGTGAATCTFSGLSSATAGIWEINFNTNPPGGSNQADHFDWSITVSDGGAEVPGRVYSEEYHMYQAAAADVTFWYQGETGYQYRGSHLGYNGVGSFFRGDVTGIRQNGTCVSAYRNILTSNTSPDSLTPGFSLSALGECGAPYKIFFEPPDPALPASGLLPDGSTTWLLPAVQAPTLSNLGFVGDSTSVRSGDITFDVTGFTGQVDVYIDVDNNGVFDDPIDVALGGFASGGSGTAHFDGIDGLGSPVPAIQEIGVRAEITRVGELHFASWDVENRTEGLEVEVTRGGSGILPLYWNDTFDPSGGAPCDAVADGTAGTTSAGGAHLWGPDGPCPTNWGNQKAVDDWTFVPVDVADEILVPGDVLPAGCNVAANGSFESPNIQDDPGHPNNGVVNGWVVWRTTTDPIDGWETISGTVDILRYYNNASDGAQSIDLLGTAPATFQQTFTGLVPGEPYTFSVDYSGHSTTGSRADLSVDVGSGFQLIQSLSPVANSVANGSAGLPSTPQHTVTWSTFSHTFVAAGTEATIRFVNTGTLPSTGLFIDNFTFGGQAPCDFGDAPDQFGTTSATNGAMHAVPGYDPDSNTAPSMLGSRISVEADGQPSVAADADTFDDGVVDPIVLLMGQSMAVEVVVTNAPTEPATLAGWIDLNDDGVFDPGELQWVEVPGSSGTTTQTLTFPAIGVHGDGTYARFRLFPGTFANPADILPTGPTSAGEVEDYPVEGPVVTPPLQTCTPEEVLATQRFWFFGDRSGMDFGLDGSDPTFTAWDSATTNPTSLEGSTVITNIAGELQFTSNGQSIWNRNHELMPNGSGLIGNPTSVQTVAAFPSVDRSGVYFVVTNNTNVSGGTLYWSEVDMALNGGLGGVVAATKNTQLGSTGTAMEASSAVPNADGTGFWVLTYTGSSPDFLAYEFNGDGPVGGAVVSTMPTLNRNNRGSINISPDLTQLVVLTSGAATGVSNGIEVRILDFNATTGVPAQTLSWLPVDGASNTGYTADFSPSGDYVYVSEWGNGRLWRYAVAGAADGDAVKASEELLNDPAGGTGVSGQVKRAPDGRMYVATNNAQFLRVINDPDDPGDPGFVYDGFALGPTTTTHSTYGLPQMTTGCPPPLPMDWGDAPDTYGTSAANDGPSHAIPGLDPDTNTAPLMLGSLIDGELDGLPSVTADGDDLDNIADEDAFTTPIVFEPGSTTASLTVPVTNNTTGSPITLSGWIDANNNGSFQTGEFASAPAPDGATSVTLNWSGLTPFVDGSEPMVRLRITSAVFDDNPGTAVDERALGAAPDGEAEDHLGLVASPIPLSCGDTYIETFGAGTGYGPPLPAGQTSYLYEGSGVVHDGEYALMANPSPSGGSWWHSGSDHTPGDTNGRMMVINAAFAPGIFFQKTFSGLAVGSSYDFGSWITNANRAGSPILPNVTFRVVDPATGAILGEVDTGNIPRAGSLIWNHYGMQFDATQTSVRLEIVNNAPGGSGNDLAIDDISFGQVCDFGDAPDSYGTTLGNNGPGHIIVPGLFLGSEIDSEPDGQPSVGADGDDLDNIADEDGVAINPSIPGNVMVTQAGGLNTAEITVTGSGFLSAWIDLDHDGVIDAGEAIFNDVPVVDGLNSLVFTVSDTVSHGQTYARFRLTSQEGVANTPTGPAPDGEVEDYLVHVAAPVSQACEAGLVNSGFEAPAVTGATPFIQQFGGGTIKIYHENVVPGWSFVAADPNAGTEVQRNAIEIWGTASPAAHEGSQFAEINAYVFGYLYQDMVTTPGTTLTWQFAHRGRSGEDTIALNIGVPGATIEQTVETTGNAAWQLYTGEYVVPSGQFITRFEFEAVASAGGNAAAGNFLDAIEFGVECPTDFGDAPDSYGTRQVDDGARHQISDYDEGINTAELMLGALIDSELDGTPGLDSDGDDNNIIDDEDGVANPVVLSVGDPTTVAVSVTNDTGDVATLAGWIDLDGSGTFDSGERQTITVTASGDYDLLFPAASTVDTTYARFRLFAGDVTDPQPTGLAVDGEVEDYGVETSGYEVVKTANPASGTEVRPGENVTFTLTFSNIGTVDLFGVEADDDLSGVFDDADLISGPLVTPVRAGTAAVTGDVLSFVGDIPAGDQVAVIYTVTVLDPTASGGDALLGNLVTSAESVNCPEPPDDPSDPDCVTEHPIPDLTVAKSSVPADGSTVAPGDTIIYTLTVTNTGEYAYTLADPAEVADDLSGVTDDAFYNSNADDDGHPGTIDYTAPNLTWTGPLAVDEVVTITYSVTVLAGDNLGDAMIENLVTASDSNCPDPLTDPVDPDCVTNHEVGAVHYEKTVDPPDPLALQPGDTYTYTVTASNIGAIDLSGLSFSDDLSFVLDDATFVVGSVTVDIGAAAYNGTDAVDWTGDLDVGQVATVTYQVTIDTPPSGDTILVNGVLGTGEGSNCPPPGPATDADCFKQIPQPLINTVKTSDAAGEVEPGDIVSYEFTVANTGTGPARIFEVIDDLADVLDDAAYTGDALLVSGPGGVIFDPVNQEIVWTGPLEVGEIATVSYSVTVNAATDLGDGVLLNAVTSPDCFEPPVIDPDDSLFNPDCVTITPIRAWTSVKTSDAVGNVEPGDVVTYTIDVENTGGVDLTAADVVNNDDLTEVLDDASYNGDADDDGHPGTFDFTAPTLTWSGYLIVGEIVTLTYSVTVNGATALGNGRLLNAISGSYNCPDPAITDPGDPNFNPDCVVDPDIEAWTVVKSSDASDPVLPGDVINYTLTVTNTGNVPLDQPGFFPSVTDDLSSVIDDAAYNNDADSGAAYLAPILTWSGDLIVDQVVVITYSVTVNDADELGDGALLNAVTGAPNCPDPAITDPGDPNFNPDCVVDPDIEAWTVVKSSDASDPVLPGDVINYTLTVTNTGNVPLDQPGFFPSVTDDLTGVLDDAAYNDDAGDGGVGLVTYGEPLLQWDGPLAVDDMVVITYSVTVNDADELGDGQLLNAVTGAPNCPDPAITDPGDPNFNPDCVVDPDIEAWTSVKTSDAAGSVSPGDVVTYQITVTNTGNVDLTAAEVSITDDLSEVLDDASYNDDVDQGAVFADPVVTWSADLAVGEVVVITYTITVNDADSLGDGALLNAVTGAPNCPDPAITDPTDSGFNPDCVVDPLVRAYTVVKTSVAPAPAMPADTVEYTVVVTNTGGVGLVGTDPAAFSDDLSGVLDDATFNDDELADIGAVDFADPELSWSGDLLVDEVATITYSVTVDAPISGDFALINAVTGGDCADPAVTDPEDAGFDPDCVNILLLPGVHLEKVILGDAATELEPGDSFEYVVTVTNIGQLDLVAESFSDDLSAVLDDATLDVGSLSADAGVVTYAEPQISWIGDLAVGEVATVRYTVTIDDPLAGDGQLRNGVVGSIYSNCVPPDADDADCWEEFPLPNVVVAKQLVGPADPEPGAVVTYRITAHNQGGATAEDEVVSDDLSGVLDDAVYNGDASASVAGDLSFAEPALAWTGDIPPGGTVTITYTLTLNAADGLGDGRLLNAVTGGQCPDPAITDPEDPGFDPDCVTITDLAAWVSVKTSDAEGDVARGDTVTYTITIENTGNLDLSDPADLPSLDDDLSEVLDDATYNGDAVTGGGSLSYGAPILSWTGELAVDQVVTISYSITVNDADELGDGQLLNTITGAPNCPEPAIVDPDDPAFRADCATRSGVSAGDLPDTALPWHPIPEPDMPLVLLGGVALGGTVLLHAANAHRGRGRHGRNPRLGG